MPSALAMSFVSCSQFEHGYFTAYRRLAEDRPDLVLHLGDYQYEYKKDTYVAPGGNPRDHEGPETTTLAGYRQRALIRPATSSGSSGSASRVVGISSPIDIRAYICWARSAALAP